MAVHQLLLGYPLWLAFAAAVVTLIPMRIGGSASLPAIPAATLVDMRCAAEQMLAAEPRLFTIASSIIVFLTTVQV